LIRNKELESNSLLNKLLILFDNLTL